MFLAGSSLWTTGEFAFMFETHAALAAAYRTGKYQVAEGFVVNYHPSACTSRDSDEFDVNGVHFRFGESTIIAGFNRTICNGSTIGGGQYVRIGMSIGIPGATSFGWKIAADWRE